MNLTRFLGNNYEKIENLNEYFQKKDENSLIVYSAYSRKSLGHLSDEDLKGIRKIKGQMVSEVCDKIVEYRILSGEEDIPFYAERFLKINGRFVNLLNSELACRRYFNPECSDKILEDKLGE